MENQIENKPAAERKKISPEIKRKIIIGAVAFVVVVGIIGSIVWVNMQGHVYTDKAEISAAQIDLSPTVPGVLEEVFVHEGDYITENGNVARVGNEVIKAKSGGLVVNVSGDIGKNFNPGEVVASIINPTYLRVVGHVEENKGLKNIEVGQPAVFKVDAFGNKKYYGVVDEVSDTSRQSGIVFNISDKREVRQFDIKIRFDISAYPELKNGMSAKIWIYKK